MNHSKQEETMQIPMGKKEIIQYQGCSKRNVSYHFNDRELYAFNIISLAYYATLNVTFLFAGFLLILIRV
jgi:hypothetical protein